MNPETERIRGCLAAVREISGFVPEVGVILGSGLGAFGDMVRRVAEVPYSMIPGFPLSTAPGHAGRFVFGYVEDTPVAVMQGRVHLYEGYDVSDVVLPVRLMAALGAKILFVTNASGGMRPDLEAGNLMLLTDHISCFVPNPLIGPNPDEVRPRFPDMSEVYDRDLRGIVKGAADRNGIELKEGVYVQLTGPSFETPAEIRMLSRMGADAVGMSTVPDAMTASHAGMSVMGISCITNMAAGILDQPITHQEVLETGRQIQDQFRGLIDEILKAL